MSTPTPDYYRKRIPVSQEDIERGYVEVDPYRIARLWELNDPALFQAFKKVLCGGQRGGKDQKQDAVEARDAISRWLELEEWELQRSKNPVRFNRESDLLLRFRSESGRWEAICLTAKGDTWSSIMWDPSEPNHDCPLISEAEARELVEKAGGVW